MFSCEFCEVLKNVLFPDQNTSEWLLLDMVFSSCTLCFFSNCFRNWCCRRWGFGDHLSISLFPTFSSFSPLISHLHLWKKETFKKNLFLLVRSLKYGWLQKMLVKGPLPEKQCAVIPFFRVYFLKFSLSENKRNDSYC